MTILGILPFARSLLQSALKPGDLAVDCTVGNGHDTIFLATLVQEEGHVYGFDIQEEAISKTKERLLHENITNVTLFHSGHENASSCIPSENHNKVKAAIFNLGYLPGGDKSIVTRSTSTIAAIQSLLGMMQKGGMIVVVIYHGHAEGQIEKDDIVAYVKQIDQRTAHVLKYEFINQANQPPFIICIEKR
ncbi:methyltransferase domain-containing protein [bacterium LRH843]|nr:methyltransferase domain-containing protein [bacterium LRH843]